MEKRIILAMVLSFVVIFVIQMYQVRKLREYQEKHPQQTSAAGGGAGQELKAPTSTPAPEPEPVEVVSATEAVEEAAEGPDSLTTALESEAGATAEARTIGFESDLWQYEFSTRGGAFSSMRLLDYKEMEGDITYWEHRADIARGSERQMLLEKVERMKARRSQVEELQRELEAARGTPRETKVRRDLKVARAVELIGESGVAPTLRIGSLPVDQDLVYRCDAKGGVLDGSREVSFTADLADLTIRKTYLLNPDSHEIDLVITVKKSPDGPWEYPEETSYEVWWEPRVTYDIELARRRHPTDYELRGKVYSGLKFQDRLDKGKIRPDDEVNWAASQGNYFVVALIPELPALPVEMGRSRRSVALKIDTEPVSPGLSLESHFRIYAGPKTLEGLQSQGVGLEEIAFGGWWGGLSRVVLSVLRLFTRFTMNYGVSIILITVILRVATHPLNKKQMESTEKMKALQPQMKALQEKYKNDPQRLQQETWKLYRTNKVNPIGGCLPLLLTMPIFIALYTCFGSAIELRGASFLWIKDLSAPDTIFRIYLPFTLPIVGAILPVNVLPIMYGGLSIWQQSRMPMDPKQANLMRFLPLFFVVLFYNFASGVILYFFFSNLLMVLGQIWHEKNKKKPATVEVKR